MDKKKPRLRFNENIDDEVKSMREDAALKSGMLNHLSKRSSLPEIASTVSNAAHSGFSNLVAHSKDGRSLT